MKKFNFSDFKAGAVIPYLVLVTLFLMVVATGYTSIDYLAAYRSSGTGGDGARVAVFKVESVNTAKQALDIKTGEIDTVIIDNSQEGHADEGSTDYDWDGDGLANNRMTYTFEVTGGSEVATNCKLIVEAFSIDGTTPTKIPHDAKLSVYEGSNISGAVVAGPKAAELVNTLDLGNFAPNDTTPRIYTLLIETTDPAETDTTPNVELKMNISVLAEQID